MTRARRPLLATALVAAAVALAGCGGGGGGDEAAETVDTDTFEASTVEAPAPASLDPSTLPPPGEARVEVDGETYVLRPSGSVSFTCEIAEDRVTINYQQTEEGDLTVQASVLDGEWRGNITFAPTGLDNYGGQVTSESLAVGTGAMTFSGTMTYRSLSDPTDTRDVEAVIAVSCGTPEQGGAGEATAEIGGETFTFEASGAQSYECEITPTSVRVVVNRLALEDKQIQVEGTQQSGEWLANVYVISGTDRYNAIVPPDGTGLEIAGSTLTFTGTFTHTSEADPALEQEVAGSASVTCP